MAKYKSIFKPGLFEGDVILITGGGSGIGRCVAHELASLGATTVIAGRKIDQLMKVAEEIKKFGGKVDYVQMNIRNEESVKQAITNILQKHHKISGLVNNAGGQFPSPAEAITPNGWKTVIDLNLNGTWMVTSTVYNQYMNQHGGSIVSIVADMWNGFPFMAHTGAARAGVVNLTQTLAIEWARNGVRINAVAPGIILGSGLKNYPEQIQDQLIEDIESGFNPMGRYGTESEVSAAVVFLLSPGASYITGVTLRVDGASSLCKQTHAMKSFLAKKSKVPAYIGWPNSLKSDLPPKVEAQLLSKL